MTDTEDLAARARQTALNLMRAAGVEPTCAVQVPGEVLHHAVAQLMLLATLTDQDTTVHHRETELAIMAGHAWCAGDETALRRIHRDLDLA